MRSISNGRLRLKIPIIAVGILLWAMTSARADELVEYGFGASNPATFAPTFLAEGLSASPISQGAGMLGNISGSPKSGLSTTSGNPANALFTRGPVETTEAAAASASRYFSLTITPDDGAVVSLSSLTFEYRRDFSSAASKFFVRTDADDDLFNTTIGSGNLLGFNGDGVGWRQASVDLSGVAALQNMVDPVTFRIYFYDASGDTAIGRYDNFSFNGTVPEPATAGLLGLAGLSLARRRRRREEAT